MINKLKLKKKYFLLLYLPILLNHLVNITNSSISEKLEKLNFYDFFSSVFLFLFLFLIGKNIKYLLNLPYISTAIVSYFFSFFLLDNLILFFNTQLKFSNLFILVNVIWLVFFIVFKIEFLEILKIIASYISLNIFNNFFFGYLSKNENIIGDVKDIHFEHVKNIYQKNYFYSMNNSTLEGYSQFIAYFQATLNKISISILEFEHLTSSINVLYFLTLLLIYELEFSNSSKYLMMVLFTSLVLNSEWLKLLFVDSLMTEGSLSFLFCALIISLGKEVNKASKNQYIIFLLLGILYFAKQFISLLSLLVIIYYLFNKKSRVFAIAGLFGILIKELSYFTYFNNLIKNHHLREVDFLDTIFDLILFRDLKLENILTILNNLYLDKPITLIFVIFLILEFIFFYKTGFQDKEMNLYSFVIFANFIFVFVLFISIWRNIELESPIRYMLNLLHLILIKQFKVIDLFENDFKSSK